MDSIFDRCCPKKPKHSLDYIIKWIDESDKTLKELSSWKEQIEEDDLKTLFDTYAGSYPWDQVPIIGTLQGDVSELQHDLRSLETDVDSRLEARIEKPAECVAGNVPIWTENTGLDGEGRAIDEDLPSADSVDLITSGAVYTALQNKSDAGHSHDTIFSGNTSISIDGDEGTISIAASNSDSGGETTITPNNIENLDRALQDPDTTPISGSNNLVTSGGVYGRLEFIRQDLINRIETIKELFNSLNERVSNLENPQYSDTGIVITNDRYSDRATQNSDVYNELQIGSQAKVEIEYQNGEYSDTLYVTVVDKMSGPPRTFFDKDIYAANVTGVTLYKRIS